MYFTGSVSLGTLVVFGVRNPIELLSETQPKTSIISLAKLIQSETPMGLDGDYVSRTGPQILSLDKGQIRI